MFVITPLSHFIRTIDTAVEILHSSKNSKTVQPTLRDRINDSSEEVSEWAKSVYIAHRIQGGALRHLVGYYPISFDKFQDRFSNVSPADKAAWQTRRQRIFLPSSVHTPSPPLAIVETGHAISTLSIRSRSTTSPVTNTRHCFRSIWIPFSIRKGKPRPNHLYEYHAFALIVTCPPCYHHFI